MTAPVGAAFLVLLAYFGVFADVVNCVLDGADLLGVFVGYLDIKGLFEGHHQLYLVQRVRPKIVDKRCCRRNFAFLDTKLLQYDLLYLVIYGCHMGTTSCQRYEQCSGALELLQRRRSRIWNKQNTLYRY